MAKRKNELAGKLGGGEAANAPGWKDQIVRPPEAQPQAEPSPTPPEEQAEAPPPLPQYQRKTYLIRPQMVRRIKATAKRYKVGQNELVRFLLNDALERLDSGQLELPLEETYRIIE